MPHATETSFQHIHVTQLARSFGAEISGVDFSQPVPSNVFDEVLEAITKYGVLVCRQAALDDKRHVEFSRLFGDLDDIKPYLTLGRKNRFAYDELFDVSNQEDDGSISQPDSKRDHLGKGNGLFHVDSSFNPRRAGFSLLRAHELPPPGHGGNTEFADTRTAFDELPEPLKEKLLSNDYIGAHSLWHSRKKAAPVDSPWTKDFDPLRYPFGRHKIVQLHERSGRTNLYIANHIHHLELRDGTWVDEKEGTALIEELLAHATQEKYVLSVEWKEPGDLVIWDNTCVMHRAAPGGIFRSRGSGGI